MRFKIFTILVLLAVAASAEVYRSVDEQGNVTFTDKPGPGAEPIEIKEAQTVRIPPAPDIDYSPKKEPEKPYTEVTILSPQNDQAIRDDAGSVTVNVGVKPGLQPADNMVLFLDGKEIMLGKAMAKAFSGLDRGTHTVRAAVKDANGKVQQSSSTVSFHLLRNSVLNRNRGS